MRNFYNLLHRIGDGDGPPGFSCRPTRSCKSVNDVASASQRLGCLQPDAPCCVLSRRRYDGRMDKFCSTRCVERRRRDHARHQCGHSYTWTTPHPHVPHGTAITVYDTTASHQTASGKLLRSLYSVASNILLEQVHARLKHSQNTPGRQASARHRAPWKPVSSPRLHDTLFEHVRREEPLSQASSLSAWGGSPSARAVASR